jgi:radical SAM superfamily enzyme YgiQ (UPF0313 family)
LRGDTVTPKLAEALHKAGCTMASIGLESGSPRMQSIMQKNLDLHSVQRSIRLLQDKGISVVVSLLVGFYTEDIHSIEGTKEFIQMARPDLIRINIWEPTPIEGSSPLAQKYDFEQTALGWNHNTMSENEACAAASELYSSDIGVPFLPPFSSVFDQWPELVAKGLNSQQCIQIFTEYYKITCGHIPLIPELQIGYE